MHTTNLRQVGGSVMLAVPPAILELLRLKPGAKVGLTVDHGRLVIEPAPEPTYSLEELLAGTDYSQPRSAEDQEWLASPPVGRELI